MREFSSFLLSLLCLVAAFTLSSQAPVINVWPQPTSVSWTEPAVVPLSPLFRALPPIPDHPYLRAAVRRCAYTLLHERHQQIVPPTVSLAAAPPLRYLSISIADSSAPLAHGADESYTLGIVSGLANLTARTAWGAMRGLETLAQLAWGADQVVIPTDIFIADRPLFPHRGLLLDTSRNFYPMGDVLRTIRAMAYNKMNVFHWHISDSQSFPLLLPSVPELAIKGSYGPKMRYSATDVHRVVRYAMRRGVRVIPEFDAPGHTGSWAGAYPEIVTCADKFWSPPGGPLLAAEPGTGQLNPLHPKTYEAVSKVHGDAADLFPDPFFHAGGDEVAPACWASDPTIQAFLSHGGTHDQLLEIFINITHPHLVSLNRTVVYWEDVLLGPTVKVDPSLLPTESTVIQTWNKGPTNTKRITAAGYRVIVSSADFYYLDCGHGGWVGNDSRYDKQISDDPGRPFNYAGGNGGSWCAPFKSWQRVYDYDITHGLSAEEAARVVGGEVALWSEQADAAVVDGRVWPRAAAMAEALWSGNRDASGKKRYAAATDRLNEWRHRMLRRGIRAEPIQPLWCMLHPGMCNLVQ